MEKLFHSWGNPNWAGKTQAGQKRTILGAVFWELKWNSPSPRPDTEHCVSAADLGELITAVTDCCHLKPGKNALSESTFN